MSTNPPAPQFANVAVSKDKTSATLTLGQTNYHLDAKVLSDLITTPEVALANGAPAALLALIVIAVIVIELFVPTVTLPVPASLIIIACGGLSVLCVLLRTPRRRVLALVRSIAEGSH